MEDLNKDGKYYKWEIFYYCICCYLFGVLGIDMIFGVFVWS